MNQQYIKFDDSFRTGKSVEIEALVGSVGISITGDFFGTSCNISYNDARKLVEMLIKHTHPGQKLSLPMPVVAPQLLLTWKSMRDGLRYAIDVDNEADATSRAMSLKRSNPETPLRLAQVIKEFVQPNPVYEWKDL